jgi:hypothetical protein
MHGLITSIENLLTKKATGTNYKMVALCPLPFVVAPVPDIPERVEKIACVLTLRASLFLLQQELSGILGRDIQTQNGYLRAHRFG